jgi:hypothetical protein
MACVGAFNEAMYFLLSRVIAYECLIFIRFIATKLVVKMSNRDGQFHPVFEIEHKIQKGHGIDSAANRNNNFLTSLDKSIFENELLERFE